MIQITTPVAQIMTKKPRTVAPNDTLESVRSILEREGFHHLPVVEANHLVGIVSYTDYLCVVQKVYDNAYEKHQNASMLNAVLVKDVMSTEVVSLSPSDTVEDALAVFNNNRFHAVPVVEGDRRLVGILSTHDLIKALEKVLAPEIDYATI